MKLFEQYKGLRREMYVLFYARIVTNMGAVIRPLMTLILANKIGLNASQIAYFLLLVTAVQLPCTIISGKLADKFNKKKIIVICDIITIICYLSCAFIPVGYAFVFLMAFGSIFGNMERPCFDALVADLTKSSDRDRAYSLNYLGINIGLVLAPSIGGLLFDNLLWLACLITGLMTAVSTVMLIIFIKDISREVDDKQNTNKYENDAHGENIFKVLKNRPVILLFIVLSGVSYFIYHNFGYLIPINLEMLYGSQGAVFFGTITSVNAVVVIIFTPLLTKWCKKIPDVIKILLGQICIAIGLGLYIFIQGIIPMYYVSMFIFTIGEIFGAIGGMPFITKRIPASHRGRISSVRMIFSAICASLGMLGIGSLADSTIITNVWLFIASFAFINIALHCVLSLCDKKKYKSLY